MVKSKTTSIDFGKFVIKPSDIGYKTEVAEELSPIVGQSRKKFHSRRQTADARPPIMLYPGE